MSLLLTSSKCPSLPRLISRNVQGYRKTSCSYRRTSLKLQRSDERKIWGCVMREKRGLVFVRCSPEDGKGDEKVEKSKETVEETYERSLRSIGVDNAAAKKILDTWKESGSDNPDALRRLFLKGSLRPLGVTFGQALLDLGAVAGALSAANAFSSMDEFPFKIGVEAVCYFVGFYFLSNLFFDAITLSVVVYSTVRFGTNTEAYLAAVERIAGDFGVVNKAQAAVDAIKVVQALNTIAEILQEGGVLQGEDNASTLSNLSAYLVLVRAKEDFGFDPASYNLSDDDATKIANQFCQYDLNDDGVLEAVELGRLCDALGQSLSADELETAMKIIDSDGSGVIEFDEFVEWWVNKVNPDKISA